MAFISVLSSLEYALFTDLQNKLVIMFLLGQKNVLVYFSFIFFLCFILQNQSS